MRGLTNDLLSPRAEAGLPALDEYLEASARLLCPDHQRSGYVLVLSPEFNITRRLLEELAPLSSPCILLIVWGICLDVFINGPSKDWSPVVRCA